MLVYLVHLVWALVQAKMTWPAREELLKSSNMEIYAAGSNYSGYLKKLK